MSKILFVCLGNVARSQMAEAFYNHFSKSKDAWSAGTLDFTPKKYGTPIKEVIAVMREENIDVSNQKVKTVTESMVNESEEIYVMCKPEECPDFLKDSEKTVFWKIEDPFGENVDTFRSKRDEIKKRVLNLKSL
jgi:arsenate reductase (thioredoxin)